MQNNAWDESNQEQKSTTVSKLFWLSLIIISFMFWTRDDKSPEVNAPIVFSELEISIGDDVITLEGKTNLPNNTELNASLYNNKIDFVFGNPKAFYTENGHFKTIILEGDSARGFQYGNYELSIFSTIEQPDKSIAKMFGKNNQFLTGEYVRDSWGAKQLQVEIPFKYGSDEDISINEQAFSQKIETIISSIQSMVDIGIAMEPLRHNGLSGGYGHQCMSEMKSNKEKVQVLKNDVDNLTFPYVFGVTLNLLNSCVTCSEGTLELCQKTQEELKLAKEQFQKQGVLAL